MSCCSSIFAGIWILIGSALNGLGYLTGICHMLFFASCFTFCNLLLTLLWDQTSWASSHPKCPIRYFIITQFFTALSSFSTIIHLAIGFSSLLALSPEYLHIPWVWRKKSSKILSLLWYKPAVPFLPVYKQWFGRRASAGQKCWNSTAPQWSCNGLHQQKTWWPLASACFFSY